MGSAVAALLLVGLATWWMLNKQLTLPGQTQDKLSNQDKQLTQAKPPAPAVPAAPVAEAKPLITQPDKTPTPVAAASPIPSPVASSKPALGKTPLYEQRLAAGRQLLEQKSAVASIQLFYNEEINPERTEGFLQRAEKLGALHSIYLLPAKFGGKDGMRVLYGAYPSVEAAHAAIKDIPVRYQQAFATSTYIF